MSLAANTARLILYVYDFFVYNFGSSLLDVIHPTNPFHLVVCFELFGYTLTLCHLIYEPRKHILRLLVDVCEVSIQLATCQQISI